MELACERAASAEKVASKQAVARPSVPQGTPPSSAVEPDEEAVLEHAPVGDDKKAAVETAPATTPTAPSDEGPKEAPVEELQTAEAAPTTVKATLIEPDPEPAGRTAEARTGRHGGSEPATTTITVRRHGRVTTGLALVGLGLKTLLFGSKNKGK